MLRALVLILMALACEFGAIAQTRSVPEPPSPARPFALRAEAPLVLPPVLGLPRLADPAATDGDPVDLYSGLYVRTTTDLMIDDTMPIAIERTYRNGDHFSRAFGVGTSHPYDMFIAGDGANFTYVELVMADGAPIRFERISPGNGYVDGVFEHTSTPTAFYGARINWNGGGWTVMLKDGSHYKLLGCSPKTLRPGQCGVIEYGNEEGEVLRINRDPKGNITRIVSPHEKWIAFTYDEYDRVTGAAASTGASLNYEYDAKGRLAKVQPVEETQPGVASLRYEYDDDDRMTVIFDHGQVIHNSYRQDYCVYQLWQFEGTIAQFRFNYVFDQQGRHIATQVRTSDNSLRRVTFNPNGYVLSDARHVGTANEATVVFDRDARTNELQKVTLVCASSAKSVTITNPLDPLKDGEGFDSYKELLKLCAPPAATSAPLAGSETDTPTQ
jgi:YD repeat-containing protein